LVDRVVKVLPHEQRTAASPYWGWMSAFIETLRFLGVPAAGRSTGMGPL
jgi:hypothetical protein